MLGPKDETFFPFLEACFFSIGVHFSLALCEGPPPSDDQDGCNARTQKALILYRNRLLGPVRGRFRIIPPYLRLLPDGFGAQ